jgi:hypothetical protein
MSYQDVGVSLMRFLHPCHGSKAETELFLHLISLLSKTCYELKALQLYHRSNERRIGLRLDIVKVISVEEGFFWDLQCENFAYIGPKNCWTLTVFIFLCHLTDPTFPVYSFVCGLIVVLLWVACASILVKGNANGDSLATCINSRIYFKV